MFMEASTGKHIQERIHYWRAENSVLLNILKPDIDPSLFDDHERIFLKEKNNQCRKYIVVKKLILNMNNV